uniref:Uncharacterized protein n=1 Tax=Bactrocera dorsalis TaxID=27457 RepID=A0A034WAQ8_BACDO
MVRWRINWFKTLESFLTDCVGGSNDRFTNTKCDTKHYKTNYNNNNNGSLGDLSQHLQTSAQLQQKQEDFKLPACTLNALNVENELAAAAEINTTTTIEDNQNLSFTRWWFMLMQQTINYNYSNILQRTNAATATTTTSLPTAFLDELLGNVANIFSSE